MSTKPGKKRRCVASSKAGVEGLNTFVEEEKRRREKGNTA